MEIIRVHELQVGKLYRWNEYMGDENEIFMVVGKPINGVSHDVHYVEVISSKFSHNKMMVFSSDRFNEVME